MSETFHLQHNPANDILSKPQLSAQGAQMQRSSDIFGGGLDIVQRNQVQRPREMSIFDKPTSQIGQTRAQHNYNQSNIFSGINDVQRRPVPERQQPTLFEGPAYIHRGGVKAVPEVKNAQIDRNLQVEHVYHVKPIPQPSRLEQPRGKKHIPGPQEGIEQPYRAAYKPEAKLMQQSTEEIVYKQRQQRRDMNTDIFRSDGEKIMPKKDYSNYVPKACNDFGDERPFPVTRPNAGRSNISNAEAIIGTQYEMPIKKASERITDRYQTFSQQEGDSAAMESARLASQFKRRLSSDQWK